MQSDYLAYDAIGLAELVKKREVSARELIDTAISRAEAVNPAINALVLKDYAAARERAAPDGALGNGPLAGVPYLIKDLGAPVAGLRMSMGSRHYRHYIPGEDAPVVTLARAAGLNIFGKTSTSEIGQMPYTEPELFGPCRNPWSLDHTPGGSSGGAAAAVAAGIVPIAHASDGGGSIRIPASACGLFGLKPTRARTPVGPDLGETWNGAGIAHAVTRTVRDSAALLDATCGAEVGDPYPAPLRERPYLDEVSAEPGALRIAVTAKAWNGQPVDPECASAVAAAAKLCAELGHRADEARPEWDEKARAAASRVIIGAHVRAQLDEREEQLGRAATADDLERRAWSTAEYGRAKTAADYALAIRATHRVGRALGRFFEEWDVLLTPTMCRPPHRLGVLSLMNPDGNAFSEALLGTVAFTSPFNGSGHPAMSVPLHTSKDGLPVGVQFVGRYGAETTLFRLAGQLERARPWADRRPPLD
ncbi:MAG TPA: amidase [Myxococcales bacterium]|nr:amidase [Myxococcales bacterium]